MKFITQFSAVAIAFAGMALADTVPEGIAPSEPSPEGCKQTVTGNFTLGTLIIGDGGKKRESAQEAANNLLVCTLNKGILHDPQNRTGAIVANYQFQFDGPPQAGSIYTGGWSVCPNGTLALGGSTIFYRCQSGGFYNLYDRWIAAQCQEAHIMVTLSESSSSSSSSSTVASKTASAESVSGSASASTTDSASASASMTGVATVNGTLASITSSLLSRASSASATLAPAASAGASGSTAPSSSATGGAVPTRAPRRETFGAVIGIVGAALIL